MTTARRPVAYLRRSSATTANGAGRVSFDVQRAAVLDLARRHGDPEPDLIVEWGASGAAAETAFGGTSRGGKRHAYHDLKAEIEAGRVSALYAYSLSRLARSTRELLDLAETCVAANVPIRLDKEGDIDGLSPHGRLYLTVLAAVSTFEAEVAGERGKDRTASMRDRGAHVGRAPYGSLIGADGTLVPDPATTVTVARVVDLYRELGSPARVAKALNEAGIPAPRPKGSRVQRGGTASGKWGDATVRRILARQPGHRPPATVAGSRALPNTMFGRLIRCACGQTLTPERSTRRLASGLTTTYIAYVCTTARYDQHHVPGRRIAEPALLEWARREAARLRLPEAYEQDTDETSRLDLAERRERVVDTFVAGLIDRDSRDRRLAALDGKLAALDAAQVAIVEVPRLDWTWPAAEVNAVVRTIWAYIQLDENGQPVRAEWLLPPEYVAPS
jgi:DNA invertase Pin-like site-specific DNA recombinase